MRTNFQRGSDKCTEKLRQMRNDAGNPEFNYKIDDFVNGFAVHYHTLGPITYHIVGGN